MTTKRRSERQRWVQVGRIAIPTNSSSSDAVAWYKANCEQARAIVEAFSKVGRVVRIETDGTSLWLKARRS